MWKSSKIFVFLAALFVSSGQAKAQAIEWANGVWEIDLNELDEISPDAEEEQCDTNPEIITVSGDQKTIRFDRKFPDPEDSSTRIFITEIQPQYLKIVCDRNAPNADCNEWDWYLYFYDSDRYVWVRDDWIDDAGNMTGHTVSRRRCPLPVA